MCVCVCVCLLLRLSPLLIQMVDVSLPTPSAALKLDSIWASSSRIVECKDGISPGAFGANAEEDPSDNCPRSPEKRRPRKAPLLLILHYYWECILRIGSIRIRCSFQYVKRNSVDESSLRELFEVMTPFILINLSFECRDRSALQGVNTVNSIDIFSRPKPQANTPAKIAYSVYHMDAHITPWLPIA